MQLEDSSPKTKSSPTSKIPGKADGLKRRTANPGVIVGKSMRKKGMTTTLTAEPFVFRKPLNVGAEDPPS